MTKIASFVAVILGAVCLTFAQATTMPAPQGLASDGPVKVLVIPFAEIGNGTGHAWVGAALQESLVTSVAGDPAVTAVQFDHPVPGSDMPQIVSTARDHGAILVVFGSFQYTESEVRVTGQVVDVNFGRAVGTLKATGAIADLFKIEDTLEQQVQAALPTPPTNQPVVAANTANPDQSGLPEYTGPSQVSATPQPAVTNVYPTTVYQTPSYYSYPYSYGYSYPYYGSFPIVIGGGFYGGYPRYYGYHGYWGGYHYHNGGGPVFHPGFSGGFSVGIHGGGGGGFHAGFGGHR